MDGTLAVIEIDTASTAMFTPNQATTGHESVLAPSRTINPCTMCLIMIWATKYNKPIIGTKLLPMNFIRGSIVIALVKILRESF